MKTAREMLDQVKKEKELKSMLESIEKEIISYMSIDKTGFTILCAQPDLMEGIQKTLKKSGFQLDPLCEDRVLLSWRHLK